MYPAAAQVAAARRRYLASMTLNSVAAKVLERAAQFDGAFHVFAHHGAQFVGVVLHVVQHLADGGDSNRVTAMAQPHHAVFEL